MLKHIFGTLVIVAFTSSAFAAERPMSSSQDQNSSTMAQPKIIRSSFSDYTMSGLALGLEYGLLDADFKMDIKFGDTTHSQSANTNSSAGSVGVSMNYFKLRRGGAGWMAGGTVLQKTDNNSGSSSSLSYNDGFTMIRPEANVGYSTVAGVWGTIGGHANVLSGSEITDLASPLGMGIQAAVGYTPVKNVAMDIGYYLTLHSLSQHIKDTAKESGYSVEDSSHLILKELRLKVAYLF